MITYEDAGDLLGLAAARDQRTVGEADIHAWHADLNAAGITRRAADAALTEFYARHIPTLEPRDRRRVTTPDIISIARRQRRERLENFRYEPAGDETPRQYLARLRGQIAAVADGQAPTFNAPPALDGGPHPDVAQALDGLGRTVPDDDRPTRPRTARPMTVRCPACGAPVGRHCHTDTGRTRKAPHGARRRAAAGTRADDSDDSARRRAASAHALEAEATS